MRTIFNLIVLLVLINTPSIAQNNVGIGTTTPNASALLDITSTNRGLLLPRMTAAQRNGITSPANGLLVYDTDSASLMLRSAGVWRKLNSTTNGDLWRNNAGNDIFNGNAGRVGIGTATPVSRLHVADSSVLFTAPATLPINAGNTPVIGPGHRMMWFANKAALRLGRTTGNQSDAEQIGQLSFAAGQDNIVSGFASAAFGTENKLSSGYNFAAGYGNETRSVTAAAFGFNNLVKAQHGFAAGLHNDTMDVANPEVTSTTDRLFQVGNGINSNNRKNAMTILRNGNTGIGTVSPLARLHVADSSVVFSSNLTVMPLNPSPPPMEGAGVRMFWYPQKAAFRAGAVDDGALNGNAGSATGSVYWDADSIGRFSTAFGYNNLAAGTSSFAAGENSLARGYSAIALGLRANAFGYGSFASNNGGAMGDYSFAANLATASGNYSFAANNSGASGAYSVAMGDLSAASGSHSVAIGQNNIASGQYAVAIGYFNRATAFRAVALGANNTASGPTSTAFGNANTASGGSSLVAGFNSVASGGASMAMGEGPRAKAVGGFALGSYNDTTDAPNPLVSAPSDRIFQVGNGVLNNRSNAFTILRNGNIGIGISGSNAPLQFANGVVNRKLVLFDVNNNDHQFYGFGINANTLRYQTASVSDDHVFFSGAGITSSAELMRIKGNGNVGIGVSDPAYNLDLSTRMRIRGAPGFTAGLWLNNEANTAIPAFIGMYTDNLVGFYGSGVGWGFLMNTTTGNATLSGSLTQNSDARLKKDIIPLSNSLEAIQQLNGYSYHWKDTSNPGEQIGLLAQELQKVYPQLVKENAEGTLSINYSGMVPVLLTAIKEQQQQIEELKRMLLLMNEKIK